VPQYAGSVGHLLAHWSRSPTLRAVVGSVPGGLADAPSPEGDRRLELPFTLEVAAA
jgi:hypothetical protein